jgi:chromosome partitioning protein
MARVITIGNRKGGTGKTTTCVSLAAGLAHRGRRVLLVDLDPQAHATLCLGVREAPAGGGYALLAERKPLEQLLVGTYLRTLRLLPGTRRLSEYERLYTPVKEARHRLREALAAAGSEYDFVIIDTPPTLGLLTVTALIASSELIVPMQAHFLALDGLAEMMRIVGTLRRLYGGDLAIRGIVPTFYQERARLSRAVMEEVRGFLGPRAILHPVRTSIPLAEAPSHGRTIFAHDPRCTGAMDYLALVAQIDGTPGEVRGRPPASAPRRVPSAAPAQQSASAFDIHLGTTPASGGEGDSHGEER